MGLPEIRAEIKTIMQTVSGVGPVYDYERNVNQWAKVKDELVAPDGKIEWWTIRREKAPEKFIPGSASERSHGIVIRGYRALDDAGSSKTFDTRVDAVCAALRPKTTLNGTAMQMENPWQVDEIVDVAIGGIFAHRCEIRNTVEEADPITFVQS